MSGSIPRILIVDDEAPARARMKTLLADIAETCAHQLAGEAADARQALALAASTQADLILLDVQMPGMDGLELARQLRRQAHAPAIIFITAHDEFALQAFEVEALGYLLKPVRAERLAQAIRRAVDLRGAAYAVARQFTVQEKGRVLLVPADQVVFLKAEQKYVSLHTADAEYLIESSLQSIEDEMPELFVRVHRNALVARNAVVGVEKGLPDAHDDPADKESWLVILRGTDERLPVSRRQWPALKALMTRGGD
ncbi:LytTR family DNA-binding domain-containing protein [Lacisediminimonas sp.]|uniref:LytR/AlgR family response regulator transcription factor n=1 Tax=Lacisediminimonas sp. TaxID=3060582 RepID=UPI002719C48C|nr:LytTR family DNA-binding domain-containing protein [Lacisediminimonas sp.]MDO8299933.1 LytTR family DNA-binding domain-containing protein [Lacisediminimonas sp.]